MKKSDIQIQLETLQGAYPEFKGLFLQNSDARLGKKVALASTGESGTVNVKTDFLTYSEMNRFLQGYTMRADNRLGAPVKNMGLIQLDNCDGEHAALFEYDKNKFEITVAIDAIESTLANCRDEDNPMDAAEEELEEEFDITRVYVDYANTNVI